jgi:lipopolysaccharide/colanic/teichoic acid biosynthesis glycosyltransferase
VLLDSVGSEGSRGSEDMDTPRHVRGAGGVHPVLRRVVDVAVCVVILVVGFPLLLVIAAAIRLESRGNVLFLQMRVGQAGRPFRIWKFRSMTAGNVGSLVSGSGDPRITRVGRVLRTTKLDELPQLWNILRGEMTILGPRPEVPEMVAHYTEQDRGILQFRPGLAGPGQIVFTADQAPALDEAEDPDALYIHSLMRPRLATDIAYFRTHTFRSDVVLLFQTFALLIRETASQTVASARLRKESSEEAEPPAARSEMDVPVDVVDVTNAVGDYAQP